MPYSYGLYKQEVKDWICSNFDENARILDVGAGSGTYWNLLNDKFKHIDCVDVSISIIDEYRQKHKDDFSIWYHFRMSKRKNT